MRLVIWDAIVWHSRKMPDSSYLSIGHHLLNARLGTIRIFGNCIQSSTALRRSVGQFLSKYWQQPTYWTHHSRIPAVENLDIFVLSTFGLYSTSVIVHCMQYRVMLNSVIMRLVYIMRHSDCWCTLRPRQNSRHFADAMLIYMPC